jgi:hypothetical protein
MGVKHLIIAATVLTALAGLCVLADGQGVLHKGPPSAPTTPWLSNAPGNVILIPPLAGNSLLPLVPPPPKPQFKHQTLPPTPRLRSQAAPAIIPPGVYRTAPYSCIVVVPGPQLDDKCIVNPGGGNDPMPIIKPDLQFIPWGPAK